MRRTYIIWHESQFSRLCIIDANDRLAKTKTYGGNSDGDLLIHAKMFNGSVIYEDGFAMVVVNSKEVNRKDLKREIEGKLK